MAEGLFAKIRALFEGETPVRRVIQDPATTAEILLLARVILADGKAEKSEMAAFRRICAESFGLAGEDFEDVMRYLEDFSYETTGTQAMGMFAELPHERRKALIGHMVEVARADHELNPLEARLIKRALDVLQIDPAELKRTP